MAMRVYLHWYAHARSKWRSVAQVVRQQKTFVAHAYFMPEQYALYAANCNMCAQTIVLAIG